jgi:hypothetical protein
MSVEQLGSALRNFSQAERRRFAEWFDTHRRELTGEPEIQPAVRDELELRLKEAQQHPERLQPFQEGDVSRMFEEFAHARAQKASARKG